MRIGRHYLLIIGLILLSGIAGAGILSDQTADNFSGIYNSTYYDASGFITLNATIPGNSTNVTIMTNGTNATEMTGSESGLVAYWRFNENSWTGAQGEVKDFLGKYNGTAKTAAIINSSLPGWGNSSSFNGSMGTYVNEVQVNNSAELNPKNDSFTITGWARSYQRTGSAFQVYAAKRDNVAGGKNGYYIGFLEGSGLNFAVGDGTTRNDTRNNNSAGTSYVNVSYGQWFHFAGVVNRTANKIYLYVNGTLRTSANIVGIGNISNSWNLSIGDDEGQGLQGSSTQYPVKGNIDEVAIWNRALGSDEIYSLYLRGNYSSGGNQTITNSTNTTEFYYGTYESPSKDAGGTVNWGNILWSEEVPYGEELPANQTSESALGGVDMAGNVLLMHLNEASGTLEDVSGRGNSGRVSGATYSASGKFGNAISFDGSNDYVDLGNAANLRITGNITLMHWVKFNQIPSGTTVYATLNKNEAGGYGFIANEQLAGGLGKFVTYFHIGGAYKNVGAGLGNLTAGRWHHAAATYNGTDVVFYLDGNITETMAATGSITDIASYNLTLGANPGPTYNEFFNGVLDEVAVFNRSLSISEIQNVYKRGMSLKFQARTSSDNSTWSSYKGVSGEGSYYTNPSQALNLSSSRYIQYKAFFERNSTNQNVKLFNVTLNYTSMGGGTSVSLDSPENDYVTNAYYINITCSASSSAGLANITPYYDKFDWGPSEPARIITGTGNTTTFTLNEIGTTIKWNCYACDANSNCTFAAANRTVIIDTSAPEISLTSPVNDYFDNTTRTPSFVFSSTDSRASTVSCDLNLNNTASGEITLAGSNNTVNGQTNITSAVLNNGNYAWWVNCTDGLNKAESEKRAINISYVSTAIWAKVNTHTHTTASDGTSTLAQVVANYSARGYNVLLITNHNVVQDCSSYTNLSNNFICINSEEWTPGSGAIKHVVRANVSSHVATGTSTDAEVQNAMNTARNEGGFAIAAHSNWSSTIWSVNSLIGFQNYSLMEIYNGVIERLTPSPYSVEKWDEVLKSGKTIYGTAADDMHIIATDIGRGWDKVYMPEFTREAYITSMLTGYFYASMGPTMDAEPFTLICDGETSYHMGQSANCSEIRVSATISATNSSYNISRISLIKDGVIIFSNTTCANAQSCMFQYSENISVSGYYRLEANDSYGKMIWSNPIWVTKVLPPIRITINLPRDGANTTEHFPVVNITLDRVASTLWFVHSGTNRILCTNCSEYYGTGGNMPEGSHTLIVYANQTNGDVYTNTSTYIMNFNKTYDESFGNNFSIQQLTSAAWSSWKISLAANETLGNLLIKNMNTANNLTSLLMIWEENNTANARGEGQLNPIRAFYRFGVDSWVELQNGTQITGINGNNLSLKFEFDKNNETPIDLLGFVLTWTEFTVPLMHNVSASSITSSSAVISWATDLPANSTVYYGTSSSLGQISAVNESVTSHSITLAGLSASTAYFYKVESCSESSCSQDPQEPYTPYSFTTQSVSSGNSGGGGGGGGGGGSNTIVVTNGTITITNLSSAGLYADLEIDGINDLIANPGELKKISLSAKSSGTSYLNKCKIKGKGESASWISSDETKDLSAGQKYDFILNLKMPDGLGDGSYPVEVSVKCDEIEESVIFNVEVIKKKLALSLIDAKKDKNGGLKVSYSLGELAGEKQDVEVEIVLLSMNGERVGRTSEKKTINPKSENKFDASLKLPANYNSNLQIVINAHSSIGSAFVEEYILLENAKISGFASFADITNPEKAKRILIWAAIIAFGVFAFFSVRRILRHKGVHGRAPVLSSMVRQIMHGKHYHNDSDEPRTIRVA